MSNMKLTRDVVWSEFYEELRQTFDEECCRKLWRWYLSQDSGYDNEEVVVNATLVRYAWEVADEYELKEIYDIEDRISPEEMAEMIREFGYYVIEVDGETYLVAGKFDADESYRFAPKWGD